ncbi:MAG: PilZ domain-containing protein [Archangium sp.]|nr:PilZ domain-containing protein [Archangium sp.]
MSGQPPDAVGPRASEQPQRREERAALQARFSARDTSGAGTLTFTSEDLSTGGAFLRSDLLLEQGEALSLFFDVPGSISVQAQARVAWVRRFPEPGQVAGMGVEFVGIREEEKKAIARWLAA